jgi:hypothetical protein
MLSPRNTVECLEALPPRDRVPVLDIMDWQWSWNPLGTKTTPHKSDVHKEPRI